MRPQWLSEKTPRRKHQLHFLTIPVYSQWAKQAEKDKSIHVKKNFQLIVAEHFAQKFSAITKLNLIPYHLFSKCFL